jgi:hypothetical protein
LQSSRLPLPRAPLALAAAAFAAVVSASPAARAQPPDPAVMARLATFAAQFEQLRTHGSYTIDGRFELLDGDGKPSSVKSMLARVDGGPTRSTFTVIKYTVDGKDKTDEAQKEARESAAKNKQEKRRLTMPVQADQQSRYDFDQVEVDTTDPSRVRIAFTPKRSADDTIEGSAWVDGRTGTLISASFKLSKTPLFVDYVHFIVKFDAPTPLGPAPSDVTVEGGGGFLFFRRHFHAVATLSDYRL